MKYIRKYNLFEGKAYLDEMLIKAVDGGDFDDIKYFFNKGANIHYKDDLALIKSIKWAKTKPEIMNFLIEKDANIHAQNGMVLDRCVNTNNLALLKTFIEKGVSRVESNDIKKAGHDMCAVACSKGNFEMLKYLDSKGYLDKDHTYTCLIYAIEKNSLNTIKYILNISTNVEFEHFKRAIKKTYEWYGKTASMTITKLLSQYYDLKRIEIDNLFDDLPYVSNDDGAKERNEGKLLNFLVDAYPEKWTMIKDYLTRRYMPYGPPEGVTDKRYKEQAFELKAHLDKLLKKYDYLERGTKAGLFSTLKK